MKVDLMKHEINLDQKDNISTWDSPKTKKGFMTNKKCFCTFVTSVSVKVTKPLKTSGH